MATNRRRTTGRNVPADDGIMVGQNKLRKLNTDNVQDSLHDRGLFQGLKMPRQLTKYNLYRGITDFGTLEQFDIYQSGRSFIKILQYPAFLKALGEQDPGYQELINVVLHILEYEFKGLTGLDDIRANSIEISDGLNGINIINSVTEQSAATVSMDYVEKTGSPITKFTELYLNGIFDTRSSFKHYHGLIEDGIIDDGYENEVFTLLYWVTDNTGLRIEQAYMLLAAQMTSSPKSIYNSTKGQYDQQEVTVEFNCFPARSPQINQLANSMLQSMNIIINNTEMNYSYNANHVSALDQA